jgi:CheY-like chemotaxis protein
MPTRNSEMAVNLPFLRRYARALTGAQASGDQFVRQCLEALAQDPTPVTDADNPRRELYKYFHKVFVPFETLEDDHAAGSTLLKRMAALSPRARQLLLLTAVENFSLRDAAYITGIDEVSAHNLLDAARDALLRQKPTKVLIIEDETVIALDLSDIVDRAGHTVAGVATTKAEAVRLAAETRPGLVLADVQLQDGSSGIDAVREIIAQAPVPVVFITAFPEQVLTGERPEPTFLLSKPFNQATVLITMSQALLTAAE